MTSRQGESTDRGRFGVGPPGAERDSGVGSRRSKSWGSRSDPYAAVERIKQEVPDVITLDIEMPRMDGLTFLEKIMSQHPIPVVICSTLAGAGSETALAALEKGAVEIIAKPKLGAREFFEESRVRICDVVKSAARAPHVKEARRVSAASQSQADRGRGAAEAGLKSVDPDHREGGGGGRFDRRDRSAARVSGSHAARRSRNRDRATHAGGVHRPLCATGWTRSAASP